ncbi:MAG: LysR substrate-binding domain-containing protein [Steroidobacteraceae bacterium]
MLNLKDLKYLVAIADTGHFGKAAERCHVSQPTLSAQLKKLEQYLGVQLVERQPHHAQLTAVGREVVDRSRRLLSQSDEIVALARANADPLAGRLRIALIPTIGPYLLPRVTQKVRKALPKLRLMLYEQQTEILLTALRNGDIDLGILALPIPDENLRTRVLYEENFVLAVPEDHPLAKRSRVKVEDLDQQTVLLLEDGHCLRDQALEVCHRVQVHEAENFRATSLETLRQMVVAGLGVTLLPQLAVEPPFGAQRGMATIPFVNPQPRRVVGAVWRKTTTYATAIEAVCNVIEKIMQ